MIDLIVGEADLRLKLLSSARERSALRRLDRQVAYSGHNDELDGTAKEFSWGAI